MMRSTTIQVIRFNTVKCTFRRYRKSQCRLLPDSGVVIGDLRYTIFAYSHIHHAVLREPRVSLVITNLVRRFSLVKLSVFS